VESQERQPAARVRAQGSVSPRVPRGARQHCRRVRNELAPPSPHWATTMLQPSPLYQARRRSRNSTLPPRAAPPARSARGYCLTAGLRSAPKRQPCRRYSRQLAESQRCHSRPECWFARLARSHRTSVAAQARSQKNRQPGLVAQFGQLKAARAGAQT